MRALIKTERFLSICNGNSRNYGKQNNNEHTKPIKTQPEKERSLVAKLFFYVKTWVKQFQAQPTLTSPKDNAKISEVKNKQQHANLLAKIRKKSITRNQSKNQVSKATRNPASVDIRRAESLIFPGPHLTANLVSKATRNPRSADIRGAEPDIFPGPHLTANLVSKATRNPRSADMRGSESDIFPGPHSTASICAQAYALPADKPTRHLRKATPLRSIKAGQVMLPRLKDQLPNYPVIPLQLTLNRYLNSLQPLFNEKAFEMEQKLTRDFLQNKGCELQKLLQEAGQTDDNWLTERWINVTFLRHRSPLTVYSSPCMAFPKQHFRSTFEFLDFTAKAIYAMCEFNNLVESNRIPVSRLDGFELDNSQLHKVFGTVRKPQRNCDVLQQFGSKYVVVIHKNNFYKLPVYCTKQKYVYNVFQIRRHLVELINSGCPKGPAIGLLTHDTRNNWAEGREMLCRKELDAYAIRCIERALFTVSLDEYVEVPEGQERSMLAAQLLHGGGLHINSANRWMDKTLQLIVNPNGMAGFCCEHAAAEPYPAASIMDYILKNIVNPEYGKDSHTTDPAELVEHLSFAEVDECVGFWLTAAKLNIKEITRRLKLHAFQFDCYGKSFIKSHGLAPDSFVQMALQLAFYRQHKKLPVQHGSAHLRIFKNGRSEVIRSTSTESSNFVLTMVSENATPRASWLAMRTAVDAHRHQTMLAHQGRGVDRHLFGLKQMALEHGKPLPYFFNSAGYLRSKNFRIVSSHLTTPHDSFMAYGPLNSEGYGCCYNLRDNDITFAISGWDENPDISVARYCSAIESALTDMGHLGNTDSPNSTAKDVGNSMQHKK
ncbi:carnitine O-acetyltransferase-like [Drosophila montana]|uniref:carnitine O-acetyltransferase-like n=1 Tax=Drosophila montana TaxID=40370 RepID=UPI00313C3FAA